MGTVPETLGELRADAASGRLDALCAELGVDLLVLFGSARFDPSEAHDIDLAYSFRQGHVGDDLAVVNALGERYGDLLDLMPLDRADVVARYEALAKGRILVETTPEKYATEQVRAVGLFMDTQRFRDFQLEVLAS